MKNHKKSKSKILTIAILPSLLMSLESKNHNSSISKTTGVINMVQTKMLPPRWSSCILSSGSEVRGFDPGRGRWMFSERNKPEYDFLRKGSNALGHAS